MSGEVVLLAALGPYAVPIVAGLAAVMVAKYVKAWSDSAKNSREMYKRQLNRWQASQEDQQKKVRRLQDIQAAVLEAARRLGDAALLEPAEEREASGPSARGFLDLAKTPAKPREDVRPLLAEISAILEAIPPEAAAESDWPLARFQAEGRRLARELEEGRPPAGHELLSFKETISRTMDRYVKDVENRARSLEELLARADSLLDEVAAGLELTGEKKHRAELASIQDSLLKLMEARTLDYGDLDLLEKRSGAIKAEIENEVQRRAYRRALADSLTENLQAMGYEVLEAFSVDRETTAPRAMLAMPGGGRLKAALHPDGRLAFDLLPDKLRLTSAERDRFRAQEEKWCSDFQALLRRLIKDGFNFQVELEKPTSEEALAVVDVLAGDELAEDEEEQFYEDPKARRRE